VKNQGRLTGAGIALLLAGLACTCMPLSTVDLLGENANEVPEQSDGLTLAAQLTEIVPTIEAEATSFFGEATQHAPDLDATMTAVVATADALGDTSELQATLDVQLTAFAATVDAAFEGDELDPSFFDTGDWLEITGGGTLTVGGEPQSATLNSLEEGHDWTFDGEAGQAVTIDVVAEGDTDPQARLLDPSGDLLVLDDDGGDGYNARIVTTLPETGTYTVRVDVFTEGTYSIQITSP
jgi:hypothetical protein